MRRRARSILAAASLLIAGLAAAPTAQAEPGGDGDELSVWHAKVTKAQVPLVLAAGADGHELSEQVPDRGIATIELHLTERQAGELREQGVGLAEHTLSDTAEKRVAAAGDGVFRPYSGEGGLQREILATARAHPGLTKVVSIGRTVKGQDILALKLSKGARKSMDGSKPSTLYMSNQHAREWITPEMTRRLMHHYLTQYGKDPRITRIVDSTELWFVLSANPDGYDYTFTGTAERQWRKNLRDNDGDGRTAPGDGVDLNRNFTYKWGYDNEGSSPDPFSETFRGTGPASEPETKAIDAFQKRIGFEYGINYHSAAQLILYGVGWQVATPTPDDVLYKSLAGTPEKSAIPGYRPQVSSELYTTNGEADGHAANVNGMMMYTPEMSTCATVSRIDPDDPWNAADCASVFTFPDDEKLIQQEFAKNIPFALSVAETAAHPDQPSSSLGLKAADFTPDPFTTSYARGGDQEVSVVARKSVRDKELKYRVNGGRTHDQALIPWKGGETYGGEDNIRFDEYRAEVQDGDVGDTVEVWFTGRTKDGKGTSSEHFTYTVAERPRADTLVIAEEGGTAPARHTAAYTRALADSKQRSAVWDIATQGTPHRLGVLSHFRNAVWYTGAAAPSWSTTQAVREYINEGGKLLTAGERAGGNANLGGAVSDDFAQYYLGASGRASLAGATGFLGTGRLAGSSVELAGAPGNPLDAAGAYTITSDVLPPGEFPQFRGAAAGDYPGATMPFSPYEGEWYAAAAHRNASYMRLSRPLDLTGASAADRPALNLRLSFSTEPGYDHAVVEVHTVGRDDWTTLPDANGGTTTTVPTQCDEGFYVNQHPFLRHYLTVGSADCTASGTSGAWNSFTGASDGWRAASFDLSAYAGRQIEVSVSYITDSGDGGRGLFLDDTRLVAGGGQGAEGFETSLGSWTAAGPPDGSPAPRGNWTRSQDLFPSAGAITTRDTVLLGFGLEHVPGAADRKQLIGKALSALRR
ncbi:M14 family zinc carboxypeptidase [Streptomyces sp. NBC_01142]|uniref:M14 family metallopeptidase n=1 Tax=Streptomyces sp. NBC_01142 TaxID=2975865 RepID=UPI00225B3B34|nr:M14 family metallopeptidase [Streptomyces sp. NBC_01142]MCX4822288.1 M14 family zinc carboxypeptidase [Streptomyces sp. NBC_01142]